MQRGFGQNLDKNNWPPSELTLYYLMKIGLTVLSVTALLLSYCFSIICPSVCWGFATMCCHSTAAQESLRGFFFFLVFFKRLMGRTQKVTRFIHSIITCCNSTSSYDNRNQNTKSLEKPWRLACPSHVDNNGSQAVLSILFSRVRTTAK